MIKHLYFILLSDRVKKTIPPELSNASGETFPRSVRLFPQQPPHALKPGPKWYRRPGRPPAGPGAHRIFRKQLPHLYKNEQEFVDF